MNWQPIETAPKDGTVILIHVEKWRDSVWAAYWYGANTQSFGDRDYPWVVLDPSEHEQLNAWTADRVTHWMPLPPPPEPSA